MLPIKLIVSSKANLAFKYGSKVAALHSLLLKMKKADAVRAFDTRIVYIDDEESCKAVGVKSVNSVTEASAKKAVDDLYKKLTPAYILIVGSGDVFPFQAINNPTEDEDSVIPSDLPYACDAPFSRSIDAFTGPTRVVGRLPDLLGKQKNIAYFTTLITNAIQHQPQPPTVYQSYFAVTAQVWKKSTELSLQAMFGNQKALLVSPKASEKTAANYTKAQLKPATHFYNCHGATADPCYYGQKGNNYPEALRSSNLTNNITKGTVVAAECCYGAQLYDGNLLQPAAPSIAHTYFQNGAIAMVGSTTIAYGPANSNALADLITQFFIKNMLKGASAGRAFLEARQQFLSESGPQLDPYELKTLAQFYLLGDPSVQPAENEDTLAPKALAKYSITNSRSALFSKGMSLLQSLEPAKKQKRLTKSGNPDQLAVLLKATNFEAVPAEFLYAVDVKKQATGLQKKLTGQDARFRTFIKTGADDQPFDVKVLVVKEDKDQLLGWRIYERR